MVDAHSKWPEVIGPMRSTAAESTAAVMHSMFSRYGLPGLTVSDNGPPLQSKEYEGYLKQNGIQRILVSPYHQSSNGQAERFIRTFLKALPNCFQVTRQHKDSRLLADLQKHSTCNNRINAL